MARADNDSTLLNTCALLFLIGLWNLQNVDALLGTPDLQFYVFRVNSPAPNATSIVLLPPNTTVANLPPPGTPALGMGDNVIRETASNTSQILGRQRVFRFRGLTVDDAARTHTTGVLDMQTAAMNGTISYSGMQTVGPNIPPVEELAITGGSGMYRNAGGYAKIYLVSRNAATGLVLVRWEVYFCTVNVCLA